MCLINETDEVSRVTNEEENKIAERKEKEEKNFEIISGERIGTMNKINLLICTN